MKFKAILVVTIAVIALLQGAAVSAATVIGTYLLEETATLVGGQGMAYNGTDWYYGSGTSWQRYATSAWQPSAAPADLSDGSTTTFLADTSSAGSLNLSLGFNNTHVVNGAGSDLAFFFLWDQSANNANVTINGVTRDLSFQNVYNTSGVQLVANGVNWNGAIQSNVLLMVGEIDLSNFGVLSGAAVLDPFNISLTANINGTTPIALSMVGALHTGQGTVVPLPAPLVLLFSGLAALGLIGRRK